MAHTLSDSYAITARSERVFLKSKLFANDETSKSSNLCILADTGCRVPTCLIKASVYRKLRPYDTLSKVDYTITQAEHGSHMKILGRAKTPMLLRFSDGRGGQIDYACRPTVCQDLQLPFILSAADIYRLDLTPSLRRGTATLGTKGQVITVPLKYRKDTSSINVTSTRNVKIEPLTEAIVEGTLDTSGPLGGYVHFEPSAEYQAKHGLMLLSSIDKVQEGGKVRFKCCNFNSFPINLSKNVTIGEASLCVKEDEKYYLKNAHKAAKRAASRDMPTFNVQAVVSTKRKSRALKNPGEDIPITPPQLRKRIYEELQLATNKLLSPKEKSAIVDLFVKHTGIIALKHREVGDCKLFPVKIDTGTAAPIKCRMRPAPPHLKEDLRAQIQRWLKQDVIEPGHGSWAAPLVPVHKPDGTIRWAVDYSELNKVTKKDRGPVPDLRAKLRSLKAGKRPVKFLTSIDVCEAFHSLSIAEEDREKTGIVTDFGLYQFKRLPFGLSGAPPAWARVVNALEHDLNEKSPDLAERCLLYFDDCLLVSEDFEALYHGLDIFFTKLKDYGLKIKMSKVKIAQKELPWLGYLVSDEGVKVNPDRAAALKNMAIPTTRQLAMEFNGTLNTFKSHVRHFASIAAPITALNAQDKPIWTPECQKAFDYICDCVAEGPMLRHADFSPTASPMIVTSDASDKGVGGVLSQEQEIIDQNGKKVKREVVLQYASRKKTGGETNYYSWKSELAAICDNLKHFYEFIIGKRFILRTDNKALKWILDYKDKKGPSMALRWKAFLANFDFEIDWRSGKSKEMAEADSLSRINYKHDNYGNMKICPIRDEHFPGEATAEEADKFTSDDWTAYFKKSKLSHKNAMKKAASNTTEKTPKKLPKKSPNGTMIKNKNTENTGRKKSNFSINTLQCHVLTRSQAQANKQKSGSGAKSAPYSPERIPPSANKTNPTSETNKKSNKKSNPSESLSILGQRLLLDKEMPKIRRRSLWPNRPQEDSSIQSHPRPSRPRRTSPPRPARLDQKGMYYGSRRDDSWPPLPRAQGPNRSMRLEPPDPSFGSNNHRRWRSPCSKRTSSHRPTRDQSVATEARPSKRSRASSRSSRNNPPDQLQKPPPDVRQKINQIKASKAPDVRTIIDQLKGSKEKTKTAPKSKLKSVVVKVNPTVEANPPSPEIISTEDPVADTSKSQSQLKKKRKRKEPKNPKPCTRFWTINDKLYIHPDDRTWENYLQIGYPHNEPEFPNSRALQESISKGIEAETRREANSETIPKSGEVEGKTKEAMEQQLDLPNNGFDMNWTLEGLEETDIGDQIFPDCQTPEDEALENQEFEKTQDDKFKLHNSDSFDDLDKTIDWHHEQAIDYTLRLIIAYITRRDFRSKDPTVGNLVFSGPRPMTIKSIKEFHPTEGADLSNICSPSAFREGRNREIHTLLDSVDQLAYLPPRADLKSGKENKEKGWVLYRVADAHPAPATDSMLAKPPKVLQTIIPKHKREPCLELAHYASGMAHRGSNVTYSFLRQRCWWPNMSYDVRHMVRTCPICRNEAPQNKQFGNISNLFHERARHFALDVIYLPNKSKRKPHYCVTAVDIATRYMWAWPTLNQKMTTVLKKIEELVSHYGIGLTIYSDGAKQFSSNQFTNKLKEMGCNHILKTPYTPNSLLVERYHRIFKSALAANVLAQDLRAEDWTLVVNAALMTVRHAPDSSQVSAAQRLYGVMGVQQLDLFLNQDPNDRVLIQDPQEILKKAKSRFSRAKAKGLLPNRELVDPEPITENLLFKRWRATNSGSETFLRPEHNYSFQVEAVKARCLPLTLYGPTRSICTLKPSNLPSGIYQEYLQLKKDEESHAKHLANERRLQKLPMTMAFPAGALVDVYCKMDHSEPAFRTKQFARCWTGPWVVTSSRNQGRRVNVIPFDPASNRPMKGVRPEPKSHHNIRPTLFWALQRWTSHDWPKSWTPLANPVSMTRLNKTRVMKEYAARDDAYNRELFGADQIPILAKVLEIENKNKNQSPKDLEAGEAEAKVEVPEEGPTETPTEVTVDTDPVPNPEAPLPSEEPAPPGSSTPEQPMEVQEASAKRPLDNAEDTLPPAKITKAQLTNVNKVMKKKNLPNYHEDEDILNLFVDESQDALFSVYGPEWENEITRICGNIESVVIEPNRLSDNHVSSTGSPPPFC